MSMIQDIPGYMSKVHYLFGNHQNYIITTEKFLYDLEKVKTTEAIAVHNGEEQEVIRTEITNVDTLNHYPHIYRNSLFITISSTLEVLLYELCNRINIEMKLQNPFRSGKDTLTRACRYMKQAGFKFPEDERLWHQMSDLNKIRNCMVHHQGNISEDRENLLLISKRYPSITHNKIDLINELLQQSGATLQSMSDFEFEPEFIFLKKDFCSEVIEIYKRFFERLFSINSINNQEARKD